MDFSKQRPVSNFPTRRLSGIVAVETMQFYMGFIGTALMAPFAIWTWTQPRHLMSA
jgi:hypothetical protein